MAVAPSSPRAFPSLRRPTGKSFWKGGHGEGEPFSQKVSLPATFSFSSNLQVSACRPCRVTFPWKTTRRRPLPWHRTMSLLPGSGRHKGQGQAWVAGQHLIPAPTKNPQLIPGTINNTRREGVFYVVPWWQQADAIWTPARRAGVQQAQGGCWAKPEGNARSRPRQGHRKLMPGTKKTPSRCELQGGLERSLAAAYFPT